MREDQAPQATGSALPHPGQPGVSEPPRAFPVFAVREWAARLYEQERVRHDAVWWRLGWPFAVAVGLLAVSAVAAYALTVHGVGPAFGLVVLSAAAAVGVAVGGWVRMRRIRTRVVAATARPATVESLPEAARAIVYGLPQLRFRWPNDPPSFAAARDGVARLVPVGAFAASVLVWALTVRGRVDGSLEDWVRGEDG